MTYERASYGIMDVLGDLGGVQEVIQFVLGVFLLPISHFCFHLSAIGKLFLVKTKDLSILDLNKTFMSDEKRKDSLVL